MQIIAWEFLDSNYILCQWKIKAQNKHRHEVPKNRPTMVETLTELIYKFDNVKKKLDLDSVVVDSGKLEEVLEESTTNEEVAAFEMNG